MSVMVLGLPLQPRQDVLLGDVNESFDDVIEAHEEDNGHSQVIPALTIQVHLDDAAHVLIQIQEKYKLREDEIVEKPTSSNFTLESTFPSNILRTRKADVNSHFLYGKKG